MDYAKVAGELIRVLRGSRSQLAFSRHLGYRCNVLYTWESGRRWPTAATFIRLAQRSRIDVRSGLRSFLGTEPSWLNGELAQAEAMAMLLEELRGGTSIAELARRVETNRVSVSRWLHGKAEPRLPEFLKLIDAASGRLLDFIAIFADPPALTQCRRAWQQLEAQRQVAYGLPWSHAVLRVLELEDYLALPAHDDEWVAQRLGIALELAETCLRALSRSGLISKRKQHWGVSKVITVDTRASPAAGLALKQHWARVGEQRLPQLEPNKQDLFSYNLFAVSEADWERIRERHIAYYQELRAIIAESRAVERVVLVNLQLLRLDEALLEPEPQEGAPGHDEE